MAHSNSDETDDDREEGAGKNREKSPKCSSSATTCDDAESSNGTTGDEKFGDVGPSNIGDKGGATIDDALLNVIEDIFEGGAGDITEVDEGLTDKEAEVAENDTDDDARKSAFDTIVTNADAGKLGIDDDEDKDDENDVTEVAYIVPDNMNSTRGTALDRVDGEEVVYGGVDIVNNTADNTSAWANKPTESARFIGASVVGDGFLRFCSGGGAKVNGGINSEGF